MAGHRFMNFVLNGFGLPALDNETDAKVRSGAPGTGANSETTSIDQLKKLSDLKGKRRPHG